jgi:CopG family nickel-responsive transcriptional regulator
MTEDELTRIGVSLPTNLLERFDGIISKRGYSSRSEGIRDAIRNYIADYEWISEEAGEMVGVITIVYDHHRRGLENYLTDLQHESIKSIISSLHVHLDEANCLEIILIKGDVKGIRDITERIMGKDGVKHVKLVTTPKKSL